MRTKRRVINIILIALLAAIIVVSETRGQPNDAGSLREYIDQNEELLKEAEALVLATNSAKARAYLDAARQLHETSKRQLVAENALMAGRSARQAREAILQAISIAKLETRREEEAERAMETAAKRHEEARTLFADLGSRDLAVEKLLSDSFNQLGRARAGMQEHMFEVAIQSAKASLDLSNRAIRMIRRDLVGPETAQREIARTDELLERIDERADLSADAELARQSREAHELQTRARSSVRDGRYQLAFEETKRARTIARRIISGSVKSPTTDRETAARAIELTAKLVDEAFRLARENGDEGAIRRLEEATRLQEDARRELQSGQMKASARYTEKAREVARNTMRAMDQPIDEETVRQALERTDEVLSRLRSALETGDEGGARAARELFDRANARQASAWSTYNGGALREALANTRIARNLAGTALRQMGNDAGAH